MNAKWTLAIILPTICRVAVAADPEPLCTRATLQSCTVENVLRSAFPTTPEAADFRRAVAEDLMPLAPNLLAPLKTEARRAAASENTPTTAPQGTTAQVHASHENFNIPISMAVSSIFQSKDKQSLIVQFNQINTRTISGGFKATITKPSLSSSIGKMISEKSAKALEDGLSDIGNTSASASFSLNSCEKDRLAKGRCWGQNSAIYVEAVSELWLEPLSQLAKPSPDEKAAIRAMQNLLPSFPKQGKEKWSALTEVERRQILNAIVPLDKPASPSEQNRAINLAKRIANQPQVSLSATAMRRDRLVGRHEGAITGEFDWGPDNLNKCRGEMKCVAGEVGTDKFVAIITWTHRLSYDLDSIPGDVDSTGFQPIHLPRSSATTAKVQWEHDLSKMVDNQRVHLAVNFEFSSRDDVEQIGRTRFATTTTLSIPLSKDITFPVSLTWANRPEFLGDIERKLGMHFGLTYRLPFGK